MIAHGCRTIATMPYRPRSIIGRRRDTRSASARGYGVEHRRKRALLLASSPLCIGYPVGYHEERGETVYATVADHRVSLRRGGSSDLDNYDPLCAPCNGRKAVKLEGARPHRR